MNIIFFLSLILLVLSTTAQTPKQTSSNQTQRSTQRITSSSTTVPRSTPLSNTGFNKTMSSRSTERSISLSTTIPKAAPLSSTSFNKTMSSKSTQRSISLSTTVPRSTPLSSTGFKSIASSSAQRSISLSTTVPTAAPLSSTGFNKTMSSRSISLSTTVPKAAPLSSTGFNKIMSSRSTERSISLSTTVPKAAPLSSTGFNKTMSSKSTQRSISSSTTVSRPMPLSSTGFKSIASSSAQRTTSSSTTIPRTMPRSTTNLRIMSPITTSPTFAPSTAKGPETKIPSTTSSPFTTSTEATYSANTSPADNRNLHCRLTKGGYEYAGSLSVTRTGKACQRWDSDQYHKNNYKDSTSFPEGSASAAGNKCRNPASDYYEGVWCYTTDPGTPWELCDVELCAMDCKYTKAGHFYAGPLSVTRSGKTCQRWDSDQYHKSNFKSETYYFPEGSASAASNKCRNPDKDYYEGVWCYTTDPGTTWEQCDVEFCALDCKVTTGGHDYTGPLNVTRSGKTCQRWDSNQPHGSYFKDSTNFPEGSASAAGNKCRNPDKKYKEGVWCYTTDPDTKWEQCDVKLCDFNLDNY